MCIAIIVPIDAIRAVLMGESQISTVSYYQQLCVPALLLLYQHGPQFKVSFNQGLLPRSNIMGPWSDEMRI